MSLLDYFRKNGSRRKPYEHSQRFIPIWQKLPDSLGAEYEAGATLLELCAKHRTSTGSLVRKLRALGIQIRPKGFYGRVNDPRQRLSPEQVDWILQQDLQDIPHADIARKVYVTRERVRQICAKAGHKSRMSRLTKTLANREALEARRRQYAAFIQALSDAWKNGATFEEMAILAGMPVTTYQRGASKVGWLRTKYPELFPYRNPNHPKVIQKLQKQKAA